MYRFLRLREATPHQGYPIQFRFQILGSIEINPLCVYIYCRSQNGVYYDSFSLQGLNDLRKIRVNVSTSNTVSFVVLW